MTERRVLNTSFPIIELRGDDLDGTPTFAFADFLRRVDEAVEAGAITSVWGSVSGTLSNQTDLQSALDGKATTAQGALADTAVQPGDNVSDLANDAGYVAAGDNVSVLTNDAGYLTAASFVPMSVRDEATTPYTLVIGDANTVIRATAASAAVTIPQEASVNFSVGTIIRLRQAGTGTLTLTTTGLTINGSVPAWSQHVETGFRKVGSDTWDVIA
jgi:hypothetical protein